MWTVPTIGLSLCVLAGCAPPLLLLVDATHAPTGESGGGCRPAARTLGRHGARRLGVIGGHVHPQPEVTLQLQAGDPVKAPHLLLVHASGLTAADVGAVHATTPTLARLLTQGVRLSSLYMASKSAPARGALLTGRHPAIWAAGAAPKELLPWEPAGIPLSEALLSSALRSNGYSTHLVGLWHGGFADSAQTPTARGYDTFFGAYLPHANDTTAEAPVYGWAPTYRAPPTTLRGSKQQRESCPHWNQMGCFLDAFEKVCGDADQMELDAHPSLLDPYGEESLYMCCCPKPYLPCTQQERSVGCDAAFGQHIASLGPTPKRRLLRDALQRVRGAMRDSEPACVEFTAPADPLSLCGAEELPQVERSVGRGDIFCEAVTWQWEQLGDGDPGEFAENGCSGYVPENQEPDGDAFKSSALAHGEVPAFPSAANPSASTVVYGAPTTLRGSKQQRESCPHWNQMGCFLDAFEKVCGDADQMELDAHPSLLDPYGEESLYMCCCPKPYLPCTQQERSVGCDAAFGQHIASLGPTPKRRLLRDALQRVRGAMRDSEPACVEFTAPADPLSLCGAEELPQVERSVGRGDIFCEAVTWQWEQLGDGDPGEFAENGCSGYVPENQEPDGDAFKSSALAPGEAPTFTGVDLHDDDASGARRHESAGGSVLAQLAARASAVVASHPADSGPLFLHLAPEAASGGAAGVDTLLGSVMTALTDKRMWADTVTWFVSDATLVPGQRVSPWEAGLRSGLSFVHSTELSALSGTTDDRAFHITDVAPTLLGLAGGIISAGMDGKDIWSSLREPAAPTPHTELLLELDMLGAPSHVRTATFGAATGPVAAIRRGRWKLITGFPGTFVTASAAAATVGVVDARLPPGVPDTEGAEPAVFEAYRTARARVAAHGGGISHGAALASEAVQEALAAGQRTLLYDMESSSDTTTAESVDHSAAEPTVVAELKAALAGTPNAFIRTLHLLRLLDRTHHAMKPDTVERISILVSRKKPEPLSARCRVRVGGADGGASQRGCI